jgi:hypothetical protein
MVTRIVDAVGSIFRAWRDHLVIPRNRAEFWQLVREGPAPIDPDTLQGIRGHNRPPMTFNIRDFLQKNWLTEYDREAPKPYNALVCVLNIPELDAKAAWSLYQNGIVSVAELRAADRDWLAGLPGIDGKTLEFLNTL